MQLQDLLINCSDVRPFRSTLLNKVSGNGSRWLVKELASAVLPRYFQKRPGIGFFYQAQQENRVSKAIVSMTSFPQRVGVVWLVIECLLRQTRVPRKIIVWLSKDQFPSDERIPSSLREYPKDVVEIRLVDGDIRSHKKYWYIIEEHMDDPLVLVDDDLILDSHLLEDLEKNASSENRVISCSWGVRIRWNEDGTPMPYSKWGGSKPAIGEQTDAFFYGSGGGTYYPPKSLEGAHQPIEDILNNCPLADDLWLNAITRKNGFKTCLVRHFISIPEWKITGNIKLNTVNNGERKNDEQLLRVREYMFNTFGRDPFMKK